jgi:acetyl-CoA synthetase
MITPLPGKWCKLKPGAASLPFFGVKPVLLTADGVEVAGQGEGVLAMQVRAPRWENPQFVFKYLSHHIIPCPLNT